MGKYQVEAQQLLELVGGKDNISMVTHCVTRMRFVLVDPSRADVEKIEALKLVKGTFTQAGQFQVIIGNEVSTFYNEFTSIAGITEASKEDVKECMEHSNLGCRLCKPFTKSINHKCWP